jgi:hypothetical protein
MQTFEGQHYRSRHDGPLYSDHRSEAREALVHDPHRRRPRRHPERDGSGDISLGGMMLRGLLAGAVGVAAMTAGEKLEQAMTGRPDSYVPAHTLERLLRRPRKPDRERIGMNWAMHWGQGIALGAVRALMARRGIRGPAGSFLFMNLRLLNDQALENATGVGAPPWTWPLDEQAIDLLHKAIYAFVTGAAADRLVPERDRLERRRETDSPW